MKLLAAILLVTIAAEPAAVGQRWQKLRLDATEFANLSFQLLCLADQLPCSRHAYEQLWRDRMGWTAADDSMLRQLRAVLRLLPADYEEPAPIPLNFPSYYPSLTKLHRVKAALLAARNPGEAASRLEAVIDKESTLRMKAVLTHFAPRFHTWWRAAGEPEVRRLARVFEGLLKKHGVPGMVGRLAELLEVATGRSWDIHLIVRPRLGAASAYGTQIGAHVVIELETGEEPAASLGTALHELFHALYDAAPRERHRKVLEEFRAQPEPAALALYCYLNEALATAAGIVLEEKVLGAERMLARGHNANYAHPYIGRIGQAIVPLLKDRLESGQRLLDEIATPYIQTSVPALGDDTASPRFLLAHHTVQGDREMAQALAGTLARLPAIATVAGDDALVRFPEINAIVFARPQQLRQPEFELLGLGAVPEQSDRGRPFVFAQPRGRHSMTYFFVGETVSDIAPLVSAFVESDVPFRGLAQHLGVSAR